MVHSPSKIILRLVANPAQSAVVTWAMTCDESGGGVGNKSGQSTLQLPTIETLPLPAPSDSCLVSTKAQLRSTGTLNVSLYNGAAPPATTSSGGRTRATASCVAGNQSGFIVTVRGPSPQAACDKITHAGELSGWTGQPTLLSGLPVNEACLGTDARGDTATVQTTAADPPRRFRSLTAS
jgi:hypothetical protein